MCKSCFVCTTPYQIIASIAINSETNKPADLLIVPQFSFAEDYKNRIQKLKIFSRVILVETSEIEAYKNCKNRLLYGLGIVKNYLSIKRIVRDIVGQCDYSRIYISSQANIGRLISIYYQKRGAEIVFFDDGEGSYDDKKIYEAQGLDRVIRRFLFGNRTIYFSRKRQLYCPQLFVLTFGEDYDLSSIKNWSKDPRLLDIISFVCDYKDSAKIDQRFIVLDTLPNEVFDLEGQKKYETLISMCVDILGAEIIIKSHPRDTHYDKYKCDVYQYRALPFEVICANSNIDRKILITSGSSAAFMPKMLFDEEPIVILLHQITGNITGQQQMRDSMISYVKGLYRDEKRIIVPKTIEEFESVLKSLI